MNIDIIPETERATAPGATEITTLQPEPPPPGDSELDAKRTAQAAAARICELRKGITLDRTEATSLREVRASRPQTLMPELV